MTNEEKQAKLAAVTSIEDAYALVKECGFTGSMDDFKAACAKVVDKTEQMDMDAMDSVAGGTGMLDGGVLSMVPENLVTRIAIDVDADMIKMISQYFGSGFEEFGHH